MAPTKLQDPGSFTDNERRAYSQALLRTLSYANVKFVRFLAFDLYNSPRCKALPVSYLQKSATVDTHVASAKCVFGGLPSFADTIVDDSGLTAQDTIVFRPDLSTLHILPYSPSSAVVLGTLHDQKTGLLSDLCTRGLLQQVVQRAAEEHNIAFSVGAELEFLNLRRKDRSTGGSGRLCAHSDAQQTRRLYSGHYRATRQSRHRT